MKLKNRKHVKCYECDYCGKVKEVSYDSEDHKWPNVMFVEHGLFVTSFLNEEGKRIYSDYCDSDCARKDLNSIREAVKGQQRLDDIMEDEGILMFAARKTKAGAIDYAGEVFSESESTIRLQCINQFMAVSAGIWELSSRIVDVPKSECLIFLDEEECLLEMTRINDGILGKISG